MSNPFLNSYETLHETPPFDQIRLEHYEPAILEGIRRDKAQMEAIATNPSTPTFANTLGVVSDDNTLERSTTVLFNLCSANTCDELEEIAQRIVPAVTDHSNELATDPRMFARVKYIKEHEYDSLTVEQQMLTDKVYDGFLKHGIGLSEDKQARFKEIDRRVSQLTLQFAQNVLKATNAYQLHLTDEADLAGLPVSAREAAALAAKNEGKEGWLFTLHSPSLTPFLAYSDRRDLRRAMYMAKNTLSTHGSEYDNTSIVAEIVNLRREFAQLLGYKCFADLVLEKRMAQSTDRVMDFLQRLLDAYLPKAKEEIAEVTALARRHEGDGYELQPWDFAYYCHKLKKEKYNFDSELLRPYFELDRVKDGIFGLATRLYGITFSRSHDIPVYHDEVEAYEVIDGDGTFLAVLYIDFHPRAGKKAGAWMTNYKEQFFTPDGENSRPHVSIVLNATRATDARPALLSLAEVETFLHEFGHALHGIFANTRYQAISGTNVAWDFVELPSQMMEGFATEPEWLNTFARHYETGAPIPEDMIKAIIASKNFLCGYSCVRQLGFGFLDMAFYRLEEPFTGSVKFFEEQAWRKTRVLDWPRECCMTVQFNHIMSGGYAAGYYSYKWAEVLAADAFDVFTRESVFNREVAGRFRREVLSRGGTEQPMTLYKRFKGSEPDIDGLLKRDGIL